MKILLKFSVLATERLKERAGMRRSIQIKGRKDIIRTIGYKNKLSQSPL